MAISIARTLGLALMTTTCLSTPSFAQSNDELRAELNALKARLARLEALLAKTTPAAKAETASPAPVKVSDAQKQEPAYAVIKKADPAPVIATKDGMQTMNIRGRLMLDWGTGSDKLNSMDYDGTEIRAAWFGIDGTAWKNIDYKFEADFGANSVSVKDAYIRFKSGTMAYTVGQAKIPMSIEALTSASQITFMERAAMKDAFDFGRAMGIQATRNSTNWGLTAGIFKGSSSDTDAKEGWMLAARLHYGGTFDDGAWLAGASARYRDSGDTNVRYRARTFSHLANRFVSLNGNNSDMTYAGDLSLQFGKLFGSAEFAVLQAKDLAPTGGNANLYGGYMELGWSVFGGNRPLDIKKGVWGRPKVAEPFHKGGKGLLQVAARYDLLDLSEDRLFGGRQKTLVLGVSWYPNRFTRMLLNYSHSDIDQLVGPDNAADTLGMRLNFDW